MVGMINVFKERLDAIEQADGITIKKGTDFNDIAVGCAGALLAVFTLFLVVK
jgi:hypothetical protein